VRRRTQPTEIERNARRAFAYVRVSGREQGATGTSLEGQREELDRYCKRAGLPAPRVFVEVESASAERIERRTELHALLAAVQPGDVVLVSKVDRWSRDIVHAVQSVRALVKRGVGFVSVGESLDASTEQGDSVLGIMAWAADQERKRIKARTVGRRKELRDQGLYVEGLPPVGYRRSARKLVPVEDDAAIVREVFDRCVRGEPIAAICDHLQASLPARHGWDKKTVNTMLRSRVYLGETTNASGVWLPTHDPIVDTRTWRKAQKALDGRRLGGRRESNEARTARWLLRGLATCAACGKKMIAAYGPSSDAWGYYACQGRMRRGGGACRAPYVPVVVADATVAALAVRRLDELKKQLAGPVKAPAPAAPSHADDRAARRARVVQRRGRLVDLAADGTISREELKARLQKIDEDLGRLDVEAFDEQRAAVSRSPAHRRELLAQTEKLAGAWAGAPVDVRRKILGRLATAIAIAKGAEPRITWLPVEELEAETW
jgi:DNA invertase Pin-like site-specific DNA recombinase